MKRIMLSLLILLMGNSTWGNERCQKEFLSNPQGLEKCKKDFQYAAMEVTAFVFDKNIQWQMKATDNSEKAKQLNTSVLQGLSKEYKIQFLEDAIVGKNFFPKSESEKTYSYETAVSGKGFLFPWLFLVSKEEGQNFFEKCIAEKYNILCLQTALKEEKLFKQKHKDLLWSLLLRKDDKTKSLAVQVLWKLTISNNDKDQLSNKLYKHYKQILYTNGKFSTSASLVNNIAVYTLSLPPHRFFPASYYFEIIKNSQSDITEVICFASLKILVSEKRADMNEIYHKLLSFKKEGLLHEKSIQFIKMFKEK